MAMIMIQIPDEISSPHEGHDEIRRTMDEDFDAIFYLYVTKRRKK